MNHRFLITPLPDPGHELTLSGEEAKHARVVRLREGEEVEIFDGEGRARLAEVVSLGSAPMLRVTGDAPAREMASQVTIALALIQPERFELSIQKGTELGVSAFQPMLTDLTEVRAERVAGKLERWQKIAAEAAKQCGRSRVPKIEPVLGFDEVLRGSGPRVMLDASGRQLDDERLSGGVALIGPEGGWSDRELAAAREAGVEIVALGARRLRAETAAIVAAAFLSDLRG